MVTGPRYSGCHTFYFPKEFLGREDLDLVELGHTDGIQDLGEYVPQQEGWAICGTDKGPGGWVTSGKEGFMYFQMDSEIRDAGGL